MIKEGVSGGVAALIPNWYYKDGLVISYSLGPHYVRKKYL
jgi:hypothetical protein